MVVPVQGGADYTDAILALNDRDTKEATRSGRRNSYDIESRQFVNFLKQSDFDNPADGLLAYAEYMAQPNEQGKRLAANTYNKRMAAAKKRIRELVETQEAYLSTAQHAAIERELRRLKPKRVANVAAPKDKMLTMPEIRQLIDQSQDETVKLVVGFLAVTGCRITEALNILLSDIKPSKDGSSHIRVLGKRSKERWIYPPESLTKRIQSHFGGSQWLFEHHGRQYSRVSLTQRIRSESIRILGKAITAHGLRHSYATYLINEKRLPEKKVADLLGHSSTAVTNAIYNHGQATAEDAYIDL
ncbi:MAG: site-specific integrase [Actinobacteria bacterium]|nr:site-specific integrase [Actinomycetota bacterium]